MKKYIKVSIILFSIVLVTILYGTGYRIGSFGIGKIGTVKALIPLINTNIFVDESEKITTTKDSELVHISLAPTTHQFIISRPGYFPWEKKVTVPSGGTVTLDPIFITQNTTGEIITMKDPQYLKIKQAIEKNMLPTKTSPIISYDKTTSLWIEDNTILVKVNGEIHTVTTPPELVKALDFYTNRSDAVVFSSADSVFVVETNALDTLDTVALENIQNIFPLFKGTDPYFVASTSHSIYVLDGTTLMQIAI